MWAQDHATNRQTIAKCMTWTSRGRWSTRRHASYLYEDIIDYVSYNVLYHERNHSPSADDNGLSLAKHVQLKRLKSADNQPTCTIFGKDRRIRYPDLFFCNQCDRR